MSVETGGLPTCRLGYIEHDGFQFCHEHIGWHHYTSDSMWCDRAFGEFDEDGQEGRASAKYDYTGHADWRGQQGMRGPS